VTGDPITTGTTVGVITMAVGINVTTGKSVGSDTGCKLGCTCWKLGVVVIGPAFPIVGSKDNGLVVGFEKTTALGSCVASATGNVNATGTSVGAVISTVGRKVDNGNSLGNETGCELGSPILKLGSVVIGITLLTVGSLDIGIGVTIRLGLSVMEGTGNGLPTGTEVGTVISMVDGKAVGSDKGCELGSLSCKLGADVVGSTFPIVGSSDTGVDEGLNIEIVLGT
jgi:hypothetical protein